MTGIREDLVKMVSPGQQKFWHLIRECSDCAALERRIVLDSLLCGRGRADMTSTQKRGWIFKKNVPQIYIFVDSQGVKKIIIMRIS